MRIRDVVPTRRRGLLTRHDADESPFELLRRDMSRAFDEFFNEFERDWPMPIRGGFAPAIDMVDKDGNLVVSTELPGVTPEEVEVTLDNSVLSIKGEKKSEEDVERNGHTYHERRFGSFSRSVALPEGVDEDSAETTFKDGLLTITFKHLPEAKREVKKIPVA